MGVQVLGLGKVARVTGLDPAKPMFEAATEKGRIDKGDAEFVDIIHTNSGNLWDGCLSFPEVLFSLWSWLQNSPSQLSGPRTHRLLPRWWLPPGVQDQL